MVARVRPASTWIVLAVFAAILAARLPVLAAGGGVVLITVLLASVIEPALALVLMLSVAPLKTLIATESPLVLPVDVGQMALALAIGAWAIWRVTQKPHKPLSRTPLYLPLVIMMAAFSPSLFAARSTGAWLSEMIKWIEIVLLVLVVSDMRPRWSWIAFGVVLAAALQAVIGLYEFRGGSGAPHLWLSNYVNFRAFGTFGQPNPFSAFMGLSLPLALGLAWGHFLRGWRCWQTGHPGWLVPGALAALYGMMSLLVLAGLLVSWGRGAWLGFGAASLVMVSFAPHQRWQGALLLVLGGGVAAALWMAGYVPLSVQQRVDNALTEFTGFGDVRAAPISNENFAIVERLAHWQAAFYMASDNPLMGVGLGNYEAAYPEYGLPSWPRALGHAHNDYLNTLAETGMIGLIGYLAGWVCIVYWTLRALSQPDPVLRGLVLGLLGTWTHLAVHSLVDKLYVNNLFLHIGVMLGLLAVACASFRRPLESCEHV